MNASQAEKAHGVPRMTVGRWIRSGKLPADESGYFEEDDMLSLNAARLKRNAVGRSANDLKPENFGPAESAKQTRQEVDLRKATAQARKVELDVLAASKNLISREIVAAVFRQLYSIDATQWRGLGARVSPDIMAVCEVDDPAVEIRVSEIIEERVFITLAHLKRSMNDFLIDVESKQRID